MNESMHRAFAITVGGSGHGATVLVSVTMQQITVHVTPVHSLGHLSTTLPVIRDSNAATIREHERTVGGFGDRVGSDQRRMQRSR